MTGSATTADRVPGELAKACAEVTLAGPADVVAGRPARYLAAPASTSEAAAVVRAAASLGLTVVPRGTGTKLDWGAMPAACDLIIETRRLDRVLEHAAGDLVVSVQAGLPLADLTNVVSRAGQRLALDPPAGGTIGGILATQAAGPLRLRYGAPRDLLIGITVVRADGTIARSGGKVVKNVAGYDLGKLFAGSFGTLGLITEATFRLHPAPAASAVIALDCPDPRAASAAVEAMAASALVPSAIEIDWPSAAQPITVSVLLEGDEASVDGRAERMLRLLAERDQPGTTASVSKTAMAATAEASSGATVIQVGFWASQLAAVLAAIRTAALAEELDPAIGGAAAAGVLSVRVGDEAPAAAVARFVETLRAGMARPGPADVPAMTGSAVVLRAPAAVREMVSVWGTVPSLGLMRAVKEQFDPERRMAPGRFAGGI